MPKARQNILSERPMRQYQAVEGRTITQGEIEQFLMVYETLDRTEATFPFYQDLPADKTIRYGTVESWREKLLQKRYAPSSENAFLSAANVFLDYIGHREYQLTRQLRDGQANSRGLRKLYLSNRAVIENQVALLVEQTIEGQLEQEQFSIGWEQM